MSRGRFAPTPSGQLHIGNALTALLAWLQIRSRGGTFVLRMEDLDRPRCKPEYAHQIIEDLRWLGIDWDEGPDVGGAYAPYYQSERVNFYNEAFKKLESEDKLYPCFCSRKELRMARTAEYPGICRSLTPEQRAEKAKHKSPSYRFALPDCPVSFVDRAAGKKAFPSGIGGDFVVRRADEIFAYQLAVVVDDAAMQITDVLRGVDLLDSTPWQIFLYNSLGLSTPRFAHVPLIYGANEEPLSKRHGSAATLSGLRDSGVRPEQLVGSLAYMSGLTSRLEPLKASELIPEFDINRLSKKPMVLNDSADAFILNQ